MFYLAGRLLTAIGVMIALAVPISEARAQSTVIERVAGKSLVGLAYARLRNLSYPQCRDRCLADSRCVALEFYRGDDAQSRSHNCALFSAVRRTENAEFSDVGYKRTRTAETERKRSARPEGSGGPRSVESAPSPEPPSAPRRFESRREAEPEFRPQTRSARPAPAPERDTVEAQAPPPAPESGPPPAATRSAARRTPPASAAPAPSPVTAPPPGAAPASAADRFHIVPVFYGTDRNQVKQQDRIGYGNDRGRRLELGQALVSVPLDHKVPNIERPRAWTLPYIGTIQLEREDPNKHFTVRQIKTLTKPELLALVKQRLAASGTFRNQAIVFIHGYNTSFDNALFRTAQISYDLQFDGAAFTYSWPSGGGLASYIYDRDSAQGAERYLYEFLQMVQNESGATGVNLIAHSMGNQMLVQVLRSLRLRAPAAVSKINQIILASPDIDRDAFEALAAEITGVAKGITLYAAANDRALEASRIVAAGKPRAGDVPADIGPVIVAGIDTIDITRVSTAYLALNHSGYAESSDLLTDISTIIRSGTRPWTRRLKAYKPVKGPSGTYWRYEK